MFLPLDGPGVHGSLTGTDTAQEVKVGASAMVGRTIITIQPLDGPVYFGYSSAVTTSTGTKIFAGQLFTLEAEDSLPVWIIAEASASIDVRITEVG